MNKVLIIEDDKEICFMIKDHLEKYNYQVFFTFTGANALERVKELTPDLIILDLMLPFISGDELIRTIRKFSNVPVIVVSAKSLTFNKVELFRLGADDYLTKPFDLDELLARIERNLLRSQKCTPNLCLKFGELSIDTASKIVILMLNQHSGDQKILAEKLNISKHQISFVNKDETAQILSVKKEKKKVQPPKLYDLTTLQREANRLLGFTAQQTLDYTQSLYEKKLVTYPRTDSQYLTDDMEENALLVVGAVNSMFPEMSIKGSEPDIKRLLNSKKVSDHHAIIPTVEITNMDLKALPGGEKEILMLIASKLLCASEQEYIYESIKTEISCHGELFTASGKNVLQYGWKEVEERFFKSYGKNAEKPEEEESDFPDIKIGQVFECVVVKFSEHFTAPPKHYTDVIFCERKEWIGIEERSSA